MEAPTQWTWVWVNSWSWWWTGRPGMLRFIGSQGWTRMSDWTELIHLLLCRSQQTVENSSRGGNTRPPNLVRNLYAGQEATVRTKFGTLDWFQIGKGVHQGCILSPCLFNLYAEYIMRNAGLEEAQGGIKIARRNINNLRYTEDTTLMGESKEQLKSLLMKVKEEEWKSWLKA